MCALRNGHDNVVPLHAEQGDGLKPAPTSPRRKEPRRGSEARERSKPGWVRAQNKKAPVFTGAHFSMGTTMYRKALLVKGVCKIIYKYLTYKDLPGRQEPGVRIGVIHSPKTFL